LFEVKRSAAYGWAKRTTTRFRACQVGTIRGGRRQDGRAMAHRRVRAHGDTTPLGIRFERRDGLESLTSSVAYRCDRLPRRWTAVMIGAAIRFPAVPSGTSRKGCFGVRMGCPPRLELRASRDALGFRVCAIPRWADALQHTSWQL